MNHCPGCGRPAPEGSRYCQYCGTELSYTTSIYDNPMYYTPEVTTTKRKRKPFILVLVCLVVLLGVGGLAWALVHNHSKNNTNKDNGPSPTPIPTSTPIPQATATPTPEPTPTPTPEPTPTPDPKTLWKQSKTLVEQSNLLHAGSRLDQNYLISLMSQTGGYYDLYVLDITNFEEYSILNSEQPIEASALVTIPLLFTVAEGIDKGEYDLMKTEIQFRYSANSGRGILTSADNGKMLSLNYLLQMAFEHNDNNAINTLLDYITMDRINQVCQSYGYSSVYVSRHMMDLSSGNKNYLNAKDAALMFNALYQDCFNGIGHDFLENYVRVSMSDGANTGMAPVLNSSEKYMNMNGIVPSDGRFNEISFVKNGNSLYIISYFTDRANGDSRIQARSVAEYVSATLR